MDKRPKVCLLVYDALEQVDAEFPLVPISNKNCFNCGTVERYYEVDTANMLSVDTDECPNSKIVQKYWGVVLDEDSYKDEVDKYFHILYNFRCGMWCFDHKTYRYDLGI